MSKISWGCKVSPVPPPWPSWASSTASTREDPWLSSGSPKATSSKSSALYYSHSSSSSTCGCSSRSALPPMTIPLDYWALPPMTWAYWPAAAYWSCYYWSQNSSEHWSPWKQYWITCSYSISSTKIRSLSNAESKPISSYIPAISSRVNKSFSSPSFFRNISQRSSISCFWGPSRCCPGVGPPGVSNGLFWGDGLGGDDAKPLESPRY